MGLKLGLGLVVPHLGDARVAVELRELRVVE